MIKKKGETIAKLKEILRRCELCPRRCLVDRTGGELGFCRLDAALIMDRALVHHGEEPPISGHSGAGTIFFSSCNLKCSYCQNYQISHRVRGKRLDSSALAGIMLSLQDQGCHNIEPVTPTPQIPRIMEALLLARQRGLRLPFVYNCGGYEAPEVIKLLKGMVDIYLPDFKYGDAGQGRLLSGVKDYPTMALAAIREMVSQVGSDLEMEGDIAQRGMLIRHLVLPGKVENSRTALQLLHEHVSPMVPVSIMAQYTPVPAVAGHPLLGRRVSRGEYEEVINFALDLGFESIFTQEVDDRHLAPDFELEKPFNFEHS